MRIPIQRLAQSELRLAEKYEACPLGYVACPFQRLAQSKMWLAQKCEACPSEYAACPSNTRYAHTSIKPRLCSSKVWSQK